MRLQLRAVEVSGLVAVLPAASADAAATGLPESLASPLLVELDRLQVEDIVVEDAEGQVVFQAEAFSAAATVFDSIEFHRAALQLADGQLTAHGHAGLSNPYALAFEGEGRYRLNIEGSPEPLSLAAALGLEGEAGSYRLALDGSAELDRLEVEADGVVDLAATRFEGRVSWRDLAWPLSAGTAQVESRRGEALLAGWLDGWSLEGEAELAAPDLAEGVLTFRAEGDAERARIVVPEARVLGGRLDGEGRYDWSQGGAFEARLELDGISVAPLYPDFPTILSGGLAVAGGLEPLVLDFSAEALRAQVDDRVITANGRAVHRPGEWRFDAFVVRSNGSLLRVDGSLERPEGVAFEAEIADLSEFLPGASGRLGGNGRYALREDAPSLVFDLEGSRLAWQDFSAESLHAVASPPAAADALASLRVDATDARAGSLLFDRLGLQAEIARSGQELRFEAAQGEYRLSASLPGRIPNLAEAWRDWRWEGQLADLTIESGQETLLRQDESAPLEVALDEVVLQTACLAVASRARSCLEGGWSTEAGLSARADLERVPLQLLGLAAGSFEISHEVDGEAEFRLPPGAGPQADALFILSPGAIRFAEDPRPIFETGEGRLGLKVSNGAITAGTFDLPITGQGRIDLDYSVADLALGMQAPVKGRLVAEFEDLDVLAMFIPIADELRGSLDTDLVLDGTIERPFMRGRLELSDGFVRHAASGLVLSEIQVNGQVDGGGVISLSGQFRATEGVGHLEGLIDLSDLLEPSVQLDVTGENLKLFDTPDLQLVADSDIRLAWTEGAVHIDGQVTIPSALLAPSVLPATPVVESPDVEITAGQLPETAAVEKKRPTVEVYGGLDLVLGDDVNIDLSVTEADLTGRARFDWSGPVLPMAQGGFEISGLVLAYGQRLEITEGRIGFPSVPADNPHLNIRAERQIYGNSEVRLAGLWITGTLRRPLIEPYTTPITTRERAQTLLVTGSDFNMERGSGAVSVGTYIAPRVFISYGVGVFDEDQVISVRYDLGSGWGVMATSGERQTGIDMSYTIER